MNQQETTTFWQAPPFTATPERRIGFVEEAIQESEGWLAGQRAYRNLGKNMEIFDAIFNDKTKSTLVTNGLKYDIRKFVTTLADIREIGVFGSDAAAWKGFADIENKMAKYVYLKSNFPDAVKRALQYATVTGVGYLWVKCKASDYGYGERQIVFQDGGILDVLPLQIPHTNQVADAYLNTVYEYMPIAEAHGRFPAFQSELMPVARRKNWSSVAGKRLSYAEYQAYGLGQAQRSWGSLYAEIRYTFIRDMQINPYPVAVPMGDPGTSWFYTVPAIGQPIRAGVQNGTVIYRAARAEDCRMYPYLRLIISSYGMTTPMYDGPAFDWHGKMPIAQYVTESVPWESTGRSMVEDLGPIEVTIRKTERKMDQVIQTSLNPPMGYDRSAAAGAKIENFDMFEEDVRAGFDGLPGQVFQSILPESVAVTEIHMQWLDRLEAKRGKQSGLEDVANLENLKMNISGDQAQQILEGIGPIGKEIAMGVEMQNSYIAEMLKFMIPQWFDTAMIVSVIGVDQAAPEIFDYDPNSLIPSHMPNEYVSVEEVPGQITFLPPPLPSAYPQVERARNFAKMVRLISVPSTLLKVTQMQEQLKYLQLQQMGFPISFHTIANKLNIDNYGDIPGATEFEKWQNEQEIMLKFKAGLAQEAQQLMPPPPEEPGPGGAPPSPNEGQGKGSAGAGGRPSSLKAPPKIAQKGKGEGAPRTTITNSK